MTGTRSVFTDAIEDHLALKKQNSHLDSFMPIAQFDVGDPLDRYPGGPVRPAVGEGAVAAAVAADSDAAADTVSPSAADAALRQQLEPLNGMTPMLSLVEDIDEHDVLSTAMPAEGAVDGGAVLQFPGQDAQQMEDPIDAMATSILAPTAPATEDAGSEWSAADEDGAATTIEHPTGEQPVIVIDTEDPLTPPQARRTTSRSRSTKKSGFFSGLKQRRGRSKGEAQGTDMPEGDPKGAGWFASSPREFTWDD